MLRWGDRNGTAWVVAVVGKEWGHLSRGILGIVVHKLGKGEELVPVILLVIAVYPQILFQRLIYPFRLPIGLGVVCRRPVTLDIEPFEQVPSEMRDKLGSPIRDGVDGEAVKLPNVLVIQLCRLLRCNIRGSRKEMSHLRKAVNTYKDHIMPV